MVRRLIALAASFFDVHGAGAAGEEHNERRVQAGVRKKTRRAQGRCGGHGNLLRIGEASTLFRAAAADWNERATIRKAREHAPRISKQASRALELRTEPYTMRSESAAMPNMRRNVRLR